MARPIIFDDVEEYRKTGPSIAIVYIDEAVRQESLSVIEHIYALVNSCRNAGLEVNREHNRYEVSVPLTEEDKESALKASQERWDQVNAEYLDALSDPGSVEKNHRWVINNFASREGLSPIEWPEDDK